MSYKALSNIKVSGTQFVKGDILEMENEAEANSLVADGVLELVTKEAANPEAPLAPPADPPVPPVEPPTPPTPPAEPTLPPQQPPTPPVQPPASPQVPTPAGTTPEQIRQELENTAGGSTPSNPGQQV